jgi:glyoxylase-like metal-dependent hydrolase (beta-lactamase superfamily II)
MRSAVCLALATAFASACAQPTPEQQIVNDAAAAMGGRDRIAAVRTLVIEGEGQNFNLGQNLTPEADLPVFQVTSYRRAIDFQAGRWRQEQTRVPQFPSGNMAPVRQVAAVEGDVAFNVAPNGDASRAPAAVAKDRRAELRHSPIGILQAALAADARLTNARTEGGTSAVDVTTPEGTFTLAIDAATKLPTRVVSMTYNVNLGDVAMETAFADYVEQDGLKLPGRITSRLDKYTTADIKVSRNAVNGDAGDLSAPDAVKSASDAVPAPNVTVEEVAKGVWLLAGQSHHSMLVELGDHTVLIEAPQNEARTRAVIAKARETVPAKPLTHVVMTHHHFDHSGGVRAAVAEDLTIVAHEGMRAFLEEVVQRTHSLTQDALAKSPKPLKLQTVGAELNVGDAAKPVMLYPITGSQHAGTLLMVHFPKERLLSTADVYSPPAPNASPAPQFPFAANFVDNVKTRKLAVDRLVPIHGRIVPFSDVIAAAAPAKTTE